MPVVGARVDGSTCEGEPSLHLVTSGECPAWPVGPSIQRIDPVIPGAEVDRPAHQKRRGLDHPGAKPPELFPVLGIERDEQPDGVPISVIARCGAHQGHVDNMVPERRRGGYAAAVLAAPGDAPRVSVNSQDAAVVGSDVEASVADHGRELDEARVREDGPEPPERRSQSQDRFVVRPLRIEAVGGPRDIVSRRRAAGGRTGRLGRDKLDRRRSAHVMRLSLLDEDVPTEHGAGSHQATGNEQDPASPHGETLASLRPRRR